MKYFSVLTKLLISILLLSAAVCSFLLIKDDNLAFSISVFWAGLFVVLMFYLAFASRGRRRRNRKIIASTEKVSAKVLSVKRSGINNIILQLMIKNPKKDYVAGFVIHNPIEEQRNQYESGKNIYVYVNPDDPMDIIVPEPIKQKTKGSKSGWQIFFWIAVMLPSVGLPVFFSIYDDTEDEFHDIAYIWDNKGQGNIWEVRFSDPDEIVMKVYDPIKDEKLETINDEKDNDYNGYADLFICQQKQKVFIIGKGDTPTIDIYDAVSFEKLSDIKSFEKTNSILANGIASISRNSNYNRLSKQEVIEITTADGKKCFYNIDENVFYYSDKELEDHFKNADYLQMSRQLFSFVLSKVPNSVDKFELNLIQSDKITSIQELLSAANSSNLDKEYFNENKDYYYKYCKFVSISGDKYFLKADKIYSDSTMAVIDYVTSLGDNAEEQICGMDKKGQTVFIVKERDFPNKDDMDENNYSPKNNGNLKCKRKDDKMVFLFAQYGAICVDLTNGNLLWKFEP